MLTYSTDTCILIPKYKVNPIAYSPVVKPKRERMGQFQASRIQNIL